MTDQQPLPVESTVLRQLPHLTQKAAFVTQNGLKSDGVVY
jgi:hypothetical protein